MIISLHMNRERAEIDRNGHEKEGARVGFKYTIEKEESGMIRRLTQILS